MLNLRALNTCADEWVKHGTDMGMPTTFTPLLRKRGFVYKVFRFKSDIPTVYGIFSTHGRISFKWASSATHVLRHFTTVNDIVPQNVENLAPDKREGFWCMAK